MQGGAWGKAEMTLLAENFDGQGMEIICKCQDRPSRKLIKWWVQESPKGAPATPQAGAC